MSLEEILEKRKKLKKVERKAKKKLYSSDSVNSEQWFETNFELWYNRIPEFSIETKFIYFSNDEIGKFIKQDPDFLKDLENRIDAVLENPIFENGAFVKMSCRSPKDVTVIDERLSEIFYERVKKEEVKTDNEKAIILFESHLQLLKVRSGKEAVSLLSRSGRIMTDLRMAFKDEVSLHLLIRKWEEIPIQYEYRGFVYDRKLVALSQYFDSLFFPPEMTKMFDPEKIRLFYEKNIQEKIDWCNNFVIDFGITKSGRVLVIELNPYLPSTDSCSFSWTNDSEILENEPMVYRGREIMMKSMKNAVMTPWKKFFE